MKTAFRVGDCVTIPLGIRRVHGTIVEDRGPLGVHGRRLFRVEVPMDPFEPEIFLRPEGEIEISTNGKSDPPDAAAIVRYLKNGGLLLMLQTNIAGGRDQPRAWISYDTLGNITHTFTKDRGLVGGETPPFWAVYEDCVFTPKRDDVLKFLRSFGLSKAQAEEVLTEVGTAP